MGKQIIIGVPGYWETRAEILSAVADKSDGFLCLANILMDSSTKDAYTLDIYEHDPQLAAAFSIAGRSWIRQPDLDRIAAHKHTLYVLSPGVSVEFAQRMLKVGHALLKAGGIAVKVESTGIAHSADKWMEFTRSGDLFQLYYAFVTLIKGNEYFYSCGMHNFGLPDVSISFKLTPNDAAEVMNRFNCFVLLENPTLVDGETFSTAASAPRYRLKKEVCGLYHRDDPFYNPLGRWHLVQV
jgi:hypothetical protein